MDFARNAGLATILAAALAPACASRDLPMHPTVPSLSAGEAAPGEGGLTSLRKDAKALEPLVQSAWVKEFLHATSALPSVTPRVIYEDKPNGRAYTAEDASRLAPEQRAALKEVRVDDAYYYTTKYGSPLAYARALECIARDAKVAGVEGKKLLDFGYGGIGHLRLLASLGAQMVAVDVDPLLAVLYGQPGDQGTVAGFRGQRTYESGSVRLVDGRFPADAAVRAAVGAGYDGFISKNTLKRGYIHPSEATDERKLIRLGVDDKTFLKALADILKPGAFAMIYNIAPAPAPPGKPYIPWADGRSPFARGDWEAAGFKVLAFDQDDTEAVRALARALAWDKGDEPMDIERDLFGTFTLAIR